MAMETAVAIEKLKHHDQLELCTTRPLYRQGRKLTAVKVYSVVSESSHLLISGVPALKLQHELRTNVSKFGDIVCIEPILNYTNEPFQETFHIKYARIQSARFAKKQLDGSSFLGGVLHVCYAPEMETIEETQAKLNQRRRDVTIRLRKGCKSDQAHKKHDALATTPISPIHHCSESNNTEVYGPQQPKTHKQQKLNAASVIMSASLPVKHFALPNPRFVPRQVHYTTSDCPKTDEQRETSVESESAICDNSSDLVSFSGIKRNASRDIQTVRNKIRLLSNQRVNLIIFKKQEHQKSEET